MVIILCASIILQVIGSILCLRLLKITGRQFAWIAIALALCLMALRRIVTLFVIINNADNSLTLPLTSELIAFAISSLFVYGIWAIRPLLLKINSSNEFETSLGKVIENSFNEVYIFAKSDLHFLRVNSGAKANLGFTIEELKHLTPVDLKPGYDLKMIRAVLQPLEEGAERIRFTTVHQRKDGSTYPVEIDLQKTLFKGKPAYVAVIRDNTEKEKAETALEKSETYFRSLIEHSQDLTTVLNWEGNIIYISPSVTNILGYKVDELIGETPNFLVHPDDQPSIQKNMLTARTEGSSPFINYRLRHKSGGFITIEGSAWVNEDPQGIKWFVVNQRDITERELVRSEKDKAEQMLRHVQRMETIGNFSAGIAHDFNNLLTPILGYSSLISANLSSQPEIEKDLQEIVGAAQRAQELVQQLLIFSRQAVPKLEMIVFNDVIQQGINLVHVMLPPNIEIELTINSKGKAIKADSTQLHQIVMNLCTNAIDAMEESGGILSILLEETSSCPPPFGEIGADRVGSYLCLSVRDTGKGIDYQTLDKIFEPFFTSKEKGKGTGLGLSVVHGIVLENAGVITVSSELNIGSVFKVYFPYVDQLIDDVPKSSPTPVHGGEHILIVDDDEMVSKVIKSMLESYGYHVSEISDPLQALDMINSQHDYDLIITDFGMPKMNGLELAEAINSKNSELPIILLSGYSENVTEEKGFKEYIYCKIDKPIGPKALAQHVREALDHTNA